MTLQIKRHQMDAFRESAEQGFVRRAVEHLRASFPDSLANQDATELRSLIREGIQRAARYGIRAERDVVRFIELMVAVQPEFDELPAVKALRPILMHPNYPGSGKVEKLHDLEKQGLLRTDPRREPE